MRLRQQRMNAFIVTLAGLTQDETALLAAGGVTTPEDFLMLTHADFSELLPNASVLVKRKLSNISLYLSGGGVITGATTVQEISLVLAQRNVPVVNMPAGGVAAVAENPNRGAPKLQVDGLESFSGNPLDWEDWEKGTSATLGQTAYAGLLTAPPGAADATAQARNRELYNMLLKAIYKGNALHILESVEGENGHLGWQALQTWFGSADVIATVTKHYRNKIEKLRLDSDNSASTFINDFILCSQKLEAHHEGYTATTKRSRFLEQITDGDYDVTKQLLSHNRELDFNACVKQIREREQVLLGEATDDATLKARRNTEITGPDKKKSGSIKQKIPSIPGSILYNIEPQFVRQNLIKWRGIWNSEGREIRPDELISKTKGATKPRARDEGNESDAGSNRDRDTKGGGKQKGHKKRKARRTVTTPSGSKAATARVSFKDDDDSDDSSSSDEDGDSKGNSGKKKSSRKKTPARKKKRRNPIARRGRSTDEQPKGIIDPGTDFEVLGGVGWEVVEKLNRETQLDGALAGMEGENLPVVCAVTAYDHPQLGPVLLGVGAAAWDERAEQTESLLNSHELRKHNVTVDDIAKRDGGRQMLVVDEIQIDLVFENERILYIPIRRPTTQEMNDRRIHWLIPRSPTSTSMLLARRNKMAVVPEPASWEERLGNCPEAVTVKTLDATTQLCSSPVEMENREAPQQHRKSRVLPLHPRRIPGRTDSDTYFSSVKSIRGYTCVQLFVTLLAQFLYVRCMRKESHSHGAYQDFVRHVGAPNTLLTDNAQTQTGQKWTATSRANATKQINSVPHNQNQNQAERKIQDIKKRVILTLRYSKAPLVFWCYCLQFIVDCLNHSAHKQLDWRTPMERMHGHTPDISMFRFRFWAPCWYFEPTAKHPKPNFLPGRIVGIAWLHGDAFTYVVWTTPLNKWESGRELIRNVVRLREEDDDEPKSISSESDWELQKRESRGDRKKRAKREKRARKRSNSSSDETELPHRSTKPKFSATAPQFFGNTNPEEQGGKEENNGTINNSTNNSNSKSISDAAVTDPNDSEQPGNDDHDDDTRMKINDFNPLNDDLEIEMSNEVNDELAGDKSDLEVGGARVISILKHDWLEGNLRLCVKWSTEEVNWERFRDMKEDFPLLTARYLVENDVSRSKRSDRNIQWAKKTLRDLERATRRVARLYDFYLDENEEVVKVRRAQKGGNKKKKRCFGKQVFKYGVQVPRNVKEAIELDRANGNVDCNT